MIICIVSNCAFKKKILNLKNILLSFSGAMSSLEACLKIREKLLTPGHHDLGQVHDAMAQCFAMTGKTGS